GGIVDGRGLAAVLALGAAGAWIGTRFLASEEASVHSVYRERVLEGTAAETVYTTLFDANWPAAPARMLRNSTIAAWESAGRPPSGKRPGEGETLATDAYGFTAVSLFMPSSAHRSRRRYRSFSSLGRPGCRSGQQDPACRRDRA